MPWVLDGNNLAGGADRAPVRRAALALARQERLRVIVFFDGAPPPGVPVVERLGAVEVRYVPDADAAIVALVAGGGGGFRIVTNDRVLAAKVKASGAAAVGGAEFWQKLARVENVTARRGSASGEKPQDPDLDGPVQRLAQPTVRVPRRRAAHRRVR